MKKLLFVILLISLIQSQPVFVQLLFRHGSRYPIYTGLGDNITYANGKLGQLTPVGKRMHYLLGKRLYSEYNNYLKLDNIDPNLIYVKSTNYNRTIESVESQLLGWFQKLPSLQINDNQAAFASPDWINTSIGVQAGPLFQNSPAYHSLPIHVEKSGSNGLRPGDFLIQYSAGNCPSQNIWKSQNLQSDFNKKFTNNPTLVAAKQKLSDAFNQKTLLSDDIAADYLDNYICSQSVDKLNILDPKVQVIKDNYNQLYQIYTISLYRDLFFTPTQKNVTATPFLKQTLQNIKNFINDPSSAQRLIIYSAHDTTVANMLASLYLTSAECIYEVFVNNISNTRCITQYPEFTSNLIFELNNNTNNYTIKIRYNGQYKEIPFCGYNLQCTIDQFQTFVQQTIRSDYLQQCGILLQNPAEKSSNLIYIVLIAVLGGLSLIMLGWELYLYIKNKKSGLKEEEKSLMTE